MEYLRSLKWRLTHDGVVNTGKAVLNFLRWSYYKKFTSKQYLRTKVEGHNMYLDLRKPGISAALAIDRYREKSHTNIIKQVVEPGMTAVDLGANIGYNTLLLAREVGSDGTVEAIEPHPDTFELLQKNIKENNYTNRVNTYELAIADVNGEVDLILDEKPNLHRVGDKPTEENSEVITVESITLDALLANSESIDFVRMDIEGYEESVLSRQCMGEILNYFSPIILFEAHPWAYSDQMKQNIRHLLDIGYKPKTLVSTLPKNPPYFERGYQPDKLVHGGNHTRAVYNDIHKNDLLDLLFTEPQATRYVLLEC